MLQQFMDQIRRENEQEQIEKEERKRKREDQRKVKEEEKRQKELLELRSQTRQGGKKFKVRLYNNERNHVDELQKEKLNQGNGEVIQEAI